jgi:hypothetical protein
LPFALVPSVYEIHFVSAKGKAWLTSIYLSSGSFLWATCAVAERTASEPPIILASRQRVSTRYLRHAA